MHEFIGFVAMEKEAQFSLGTKSASLKRNYERRSSRKEFAFANHHAHKTAFSAPAIPKTGLGDFKLPVNSNVKPHHSTAAKILVIKNKVRLDHDHDHGEAKKSGLSSKFLCDICFDYKPLSDRFRKGKCNHPFCTTCISKYVATQMHQNILKVTCPNPNCSVELKPKYLHTVLPREVVVRWESARCESLIAGEKKTYCPFKDCSVLLVNDGGEVVTSAECPSCHRLFCAECKVSWHGGLTCEDFQKSKRKTHEKEFDNMFLKLAEKKNWQKCPMCSMFVQRSGGCEHISCRCGCHFCYGCGQKWMYGHVCNKR